MLNPKLDYVFKRIFGHKGNEDITRNFVSSILSQNIKSVKLNNSTILEKDLVNDKVGILDIKAILNNDSICDIEIQIVDNHNIVPRLLFYWSKLYSGEISSGDNYSKLKNCIVILIADYNLKETCDISKCLTTWQLREKDFPQFQLTNAIQFCIIEMPKYLTCKDSLCNPALDSWLKFIQNPSEVVDVSNKEIQKAKKVLEDISKDKREIYLAELREKYIRDQKSIQEYGYEQGLEAGKKLGEKHGLKAGEERGLKIGEERGIKKGTLDTQLQIIKNMLLENIDIQVIGKITGISVEEIQKIKNNL